MLVRCILGVCVISGSIGSGALLFDSRGEEAHMRYMSGCVPLVATFTAHEQGYRKVDPPYRKKHEAVARVICEERWGKRHGRSLASLFGMAHGGEENR